MNKLFCILDQAIGTAAGAASLQPAVVDEWEAALGWGRHTAGILQHHDAVTGTGGSACDLVRAQTALFPFSIIYQDRLGRNV
jgi:hypothetical protein